MSVYVDNARTVYGRMRLSHLMADSPEELHWMAARIGMERRWCHGDHYDISEGKRALAIRYGAIQVRQRDLIPIRQRWRQLYGLE